MKKNILPLSLVTSLLIMPVSGFAETPFRDIQGHWAVQDIDQVYQKGIMKGIAKDKFAPNQAATLAEFAVCFDRIFDLNYDNRRFIKEPSPADFYDDVTPGQWYSEAVLRVGMYNIFNLDSRSFDPTQPTTRLELAMAIFNAFQTKSLNVITTQIWPMYEDTAELSQNEQQVVSFLFNTSIMMGRSANLFDPSEEITCAELAAVLNRTQSIIAYTR